MRSVLMALSRLMLRLFFRRVVEVAPERVPREGPILFVLNHPSGLVDPLLILCRSPRPVSFLAKAPLFHTPVVRHFVNAFECLPVYRKEDGADPKKNREIIDRSIALLNDGNAIALFPEGTSHSGPRLKPLKSGASRIALSASALHTDGNAAVHIVPVGLYYTAKATFRSEATLFYGPAIAVPKVELDDTLQPPRAAVSDLTEQIRHALEAVTLQADTVDALSLAERAGIVLAAAERDAGIAPAPSDSAQALEAFDVRRRLLAGYVALGQRLPERVQQLVLRLNRFEAQLRVLGLRLDQSPRYASGPAFRYVATSLGVLILGAPLALGGIAIHYPAYVVIDRLSHHMAKGEADILASLKLVAGLLLFPASWLLVSGIVAALYGWTAAALTIAMCPACGYVTLRYTERLGDFIEKGSAAWLLFTQRGIGKFLERERREIRSEILALAEKVPSESSLEQTEIS